MASYEESNNLTFINPYNFVPLNQVGLFTERINIEEKIEEQKANNDLHTGYFICELTAKTPLAIPDSPGDPGINGHYTYSAYRLNGKHAIPGSSLRGVIRSAYETLTNSCMVTMRPKEHITRRSELGTFQPCVLKKISVTDDVTGNTRSEWRLYRAKRIPLVASPYPGSDAGYKRLNENHTNFCIKVGDNGEKYVESDNSKLYYGDEVDITSAAPGHEKNGIEVWGGGHVCNISKAVNTNHYLYLGEIIGNKHAESVFKAEEEALPYDDRKLKLAVERLEDTLAMYRSPSINRNLESNEPDKRHFGYKGYERAKKKKNCCIPLWYREANNVLYLSMAAIGRIAYEASVGGVSAEHNLSKGHRPCRERERLCPACAVFGMVGSNNKYKGMGSRIRITDAIVNEESDLKGNFTHKTLKVLGNPRSSYLKFYSTGGGSYDNEGASIRGRKYYWHNPKASKDETIYSTDEKTNLNSSFELIKPETKFTFKVYYDSLSQDQVDMLAWTLTLGGNNSQNMHKIGHGKPLGLGSVKIVITNKTEREWNDETGYNMIPDDHYDSPAEPGLIDRRGDTFELFRKITNFDNGFTADIRYPYVVTSDDVRQTIEDQRRNGRELKENILASHRWFGENRANLPSIPVTGEQLMNVLELINVEVTDRQDANGRQIRSDFKHINNI